jgi:hypothetical protein
MEGWAQWKYCVHMCINIKIIPAETIPGMGVEEDKVEWWKGKVQVWYT